MPLMNRRTVPQTSATQEHGSSPDTRDDTSSAARPSKSAPPPQLGRSSGLGRAVKRHRKKIRDAIQGISKPAIRRLARRAGVKRMSGTIHHTARDALNVRLTEILRRVILVVDNRKQKTVTADDIVYVLKQIGQPLWGFGEARIYNSNICGTF